MEEVKEKEESLTLYSGEELQMDDVLLHPSIRGQEETKKELEREPLVWADSIWESCASILSCVQLFFFQQTLGTITAVPIKVPQVSSLQRLAGQGPAVLPQVQNTVPNGALCYFCMYPTLFLSDTQAWVSQHTHFAE